MPQPSHASTSLRSLDVDACGQNGEARISAYWFAKAPPDDATGATDADLRLEGVRFRKPVWADLRTAAGQNVARSVQ